MFQGQKQQAVSYFDDETWATAPPVQCWLTEASRLSSYFRSHVSCFSCHNIQVSSPKMPDRNNWNQLERVHCVFYSKVWVYDMTDMMIICYPSAVRLVGAGCGTVAPVWPRDSAAPDRRWRPRHLLHRYVTSSHTYHMYIGEVRGTSSQVSVMN